MSDHAGSAFRAQDILAILAGLMLAMLLGALDQTIGHRHARACHDLNVSRNCRVGDRLSAGGGRRHAALPGFPDIFGRRGIMLLAISTFVIGSVACALSPSVPFLALARPARSKAAAA